MSDSFQAASFAIMLLLARPSSPLPLSALLLLTFVSVSVVAGQEMTPVRLSHQVAYWAIPPYIAQREGFFQDLGLNVTFISVRNKHARILGI